MSLEAGLFALVTGSTAVTDIIGQRFSPAPLKEGATLPAATFTVVNISPTMAHDGDMHLDFVDVQIDLWADTVKEGVILRDTMRSAINGFKGTVGGTQFDRVNVVNMTPIPEPDVQEERVMMEVEITHKYEDPT